MTFSIHIQNTISAANKLIGWALRTFRRRSRLVMMTIWKSLVQTKLDYCSQLWSPGDQASISKLEGVAKHFTAQVAGLQHMDYWDRLAALHLRIHKNAAARGIRSYSSGRSCRATTSTPCRAQGGGGWWISLSTSYKLLHLS